MFKHSSPFSSQYSPFLQHSSEKIDATMDRAKDDEKIGNERTKLKKTPRKIVTGYSVFFKEVQQELPGNKRDTFAEAAKIAGQKWKEMSPDRKEQYKTTVSPLNVVESESTVRSSEGRSGCNMVQCDKCHRRFSHLRHYRAHIKECGQQHKCETCGKLFRSTANLFTHVTQVHNKQKANECVACKKLFFSKWSLETHSRIHSGEQPYICTTCGQSFNVKANLKRHLKLHNSKV